MNEERFKWSIEIDHLILDATFSDPIKDFPPKQEAFEGICKLIRKHKNFRVYLFVYLLGKEEVFSSLAKEFDTKIVVDEDRYQKIKLLNLDPELYTTDPEEGFIYVKTKEERKRMDIDKYNEEWPTIFISMSGRGTDDTSSKRFLYKSYYSSHSNARELETFVKAVCPKRITYHSQPDHMESRKFRSYLTKEYTEEGVEISMAYLKPCKSEKSDKFQRKYENAIINRFDEEVQSKMNKREFIKQNPFMEKKRKRFVKTGAKLMNEEPIMSLSDDEGECKMNVDCDHSKIKSPLKEIKTEEYDENLHVNSQISQSTRTFDKDSSKLRRKSKKKSKALV